jgi:galactonate dehydratase
VDITLTIRDIKGKILGVPVWELLGGKCREKCDVYGWIGGDRPSDVLAQAKVRKEQGFTRVKMNVSHLHSLGARYPANIVGRRICMLIQCSWYKILMIQLGWLDSPHALDATVQRLAEVKSIGLDVGL